MSSCAWLPQALVARFEQQFGVSGTRALCAAFAQKRRVTFRVNTLKTSDDAVMQVLREDGITFERSKEVPHAFFVQNRTDDEMLAHPLTLAGNIYLQGIASMLPPVLLAPQPGERVLDLCAAPGSKTTQMASMMAGSGEIVALEENEIRFSKLQNTLAMQGAGNVRALHTDATLFYKTGERFDKVLADVPCTAEGRIMKSEPRTYRFWNEKNIREHAKLQRRLLRSAVQCLKPGGVLVYSTCTLAPEENELMMQWLPTEFPEMKVVEQRVVMPTKDREGFFVARVLKRGAAQGN